MVSRLHRNCYFLSIYVLIKVPVWVNLVILLYPSYGPWNSLNLILTNGQKPWWNAVLMSLMMALLVTRLCCASLTRRPTRSRPYDRASSNKTRSPSSALKCSEEWFALRRSKTFHRWAGSHWGTRVSLCCVFLLVFFNWAVNNEITNTLVLSSVVGSFWQYGERVSLSTALKQWMLQANPQTQSCHLL